MNWPSTEKKDIENQITDVEGILNYIYTILVLRNLCESFQLVSE